MSASPYSSKLKSLGRTMTDTESSLLRRVFRRNMPVINESVSPMEAIADVEDGRYDTKTRSCVRRELRFWLEGDKAVDFVPNCIDSGTMSFAVKTKSALKPYVYIVKTPTADMRFDLAGEKLSESMIECILDLLTDGEDSDSDDDSASVVSS